jgi:hypothetical protein
MLFKMHHMLYRSKPWEWGAAGSIACGADAWSSPRLPRRLASAPRRRVPPPPWSVALAITIGLVASSCIVAPPLAAAEGGATAQYTDRLETNAREPNAREQLVGLYTTELEGNGFELAWVLSRLPCATAHYRFSATEASIDSSQASSSEAQIHLLSAHLPRGIHCGLPLPAYAGQGSTTITVSPVGSNGKTSPPLLSYSGDGTKIESFSDCMTLSGACAGHYLLKVSFDSPRRRITLVYGFTVTIATSSTSTARGSDGRKLEQCPIV